MPQEIIIGDHNWRQFANDPVIDGEQRRRGLIPRDYKLYPPGHYSSSRALDIPLIPRNEWADRIKAMEASKSRLSDMRGDIPSRDQNGRGYCWAHSSVSALLLLRARDGQPYIDLSAYAVACIIKDYADEGGWGALSMDWIIKNGCPSSQFWPQQSTSQSNDNVEMRANALLHRITDTWMEASAPYDRNLTFEQMASCLLSRIPVVVDFNWWSHSVCACDLVATSSDNLRDESGKRMEGSALIKVMDDCGYGDSAFGPRIWNSWGDSWSEKGMGVLSGSKGVPDGACAPRVAAAANV